MQKTFKRTISILLSILMIVGVCAIVPMTASAAEETSTVTWDNNSLQKTSGGKSSGGVTLTTQQAQTRVNDCFYNGRGSATFTAPEGSVFTKIELRNCRYVNSLNFPGATVANDGGYWQESMWEDEDPEWVQYYKVTWTGESSEVTFSGAIYGIQSIEFTLKSVAPTTYTVTWKNGENTLKTDTVEKDAIPAYTGETPVKAEDETNTYTFSGWTDGTTTYGATDTLPAVTGDITYTATFTETAKPAPTYTVTWKNWDGSDLEVDAEVEKDTLPTYDGEAPAKAEDGENIYTFAAWDDGTTTYILGVDDLPAVTADVTYTAVFTAAKKEIIDGKYYVDSELTKGAGLVKVGNDIYYVKITGDIYKNSTLSVAESKTNGLKPQGNYYFDEEGKLTVNNGVVNGFYYVDGVIQKGAGLVQIDNDIYFVKQNGAVYKDASLYVAEAKTNGLMPAGKYFFDENGKMEVKNGVFGGFYYEDNQIVKGKGIVEFENNLYFVKQNGAVYTTHHLMVPEAKTNGLIEPGLYDFEDDGRLIR